MSAFCRCARTQISITVGPPMSRGFKPETNWIFAKVPVVEADRLDVPWHYQAATVDDVEARAPTRARYFGRNASNVSKNIVIIPNVSGSSYT